MAQKKIHKQEAPNAPEPTPRVKKIKDLRSTGASLREISEALKIPRSTVEKALAININEVTLAQPADPEATKPAKKKAAKVKKGK